MGGLWTYHVIVFVDEGEGKVRVNSLVMPHARITFKATGLITDTMCTQILADLLQTGVPRRERPADAQALQAKGGIAYDFSYELLMASWRPENEEPQVYYGMLTKRQNGIIVGGASKEVKAFTSQLNSLLHGLKKHTHQRRSDQVARYS